jgi:hypothetical protein
MNTILFQKESVPEFRQTLATVEPDFSGIDSAEDILRDAARWGLVDDLRKLLRQGDEASGAGAEPKLIRDIGYEFAGAKNRDFAVDLFIHVTGIAEFGPASLRDYARKHGCSHEWFRKEADAMRRRLGLPELTTRRVRSA